MMKAKLNQICEAIRKTRSVRTILAKMPGLLVTEKLRKRFFITKTQLHKKKLFMEQSLIWPCCVLFQTGTVNNATNCDFTSCFYLSVNARTFSQTITYSGKISA